MPSLEVRRLEQKAVLWPSSGAPDGYGRHTTGDPVEISVRWETKRVEALDRRGNTIALDAVVVVDREIAIGGEMVLGTLSEWLGTGSAGSDDEVMVVVQFSSVPDVKGRDFRRTVGLRYKADSQGAAP